MSDGKRPPSFYVLTAVFALFVLFLYGPTITIGILSFQGPDGGMSFPMVGWSTHWFQVLFEGTGGQGIGDVPNSFRRSVRLAAPTRRGRARPARASSSSSSPGETPRSRPPSATLASPR